MYAAIQKAMARQWAGVASLWRAMNAWRPCKQCGGSLKQHATERTQFCSIRCASLYENKRTCSDCGRLFVRMGVQGQSNYCLHCVDKRKRAYRKRVKKLLGNYRLRCRHYGVPYDRTVTRPRVFERDGYRCGLCGTKCLGRFTWRESRPDPRSPTVDHIIALAFGIKGHTWDNVQCACFKCNSVKGKSKQGQIRMQFC
jgi:5-methylcytosine-specific restriction endonuclease McrA